MSAKCLTKAVILCFVCKIWLYRACGQFQILPGAYESMFYLVLMERVCIIYNVFLKCYILYWYPTLNEIYLILSAETVSYYPLTR